MRGRTDRYHRIGFVIAFTVAVIATPVQMGVGDGLARWVYDNQPTKFAAIEMVPTTSSDVPEVLLRHLNADGQASCWPGAWRSGLPPADQPDHLSRSRTHRNHDRGAGRHRPRRRPDRACRRPAQRARPESLHPEAGMPD